MKLLRLTLAFIYGFFLLYFVCIWIGGFMAARQIPVEYFRFFASYGPGGKEAALALIGVSLHAIPTFALLGLGILPLTLCLKQGRRSTGLAAIAGCAAGYCFWLNYYAIVATEQAWSISQAMSPYLHAPWWAWPQILAPLLGLALAYVLLPRHAARAEA